MSLVFFLNVVSPPLSNYKTPLPLRVLAGLHQVWFAPEPEHWAGKGASPRGPAPWLRWEGREGPHRGRANPGRQSLLRKVFLLPSDSGDPRFHLINGNASLRHQKFSKGWEYIYRGAGRALEWPQSSRVQRPGGLRWTAREVEEGQRRDRLETKMEALGVERQMEVGECSREAATGHQRRGWQQDNGCLQWSLRLLIITRRHWRSCLVKERLNYPHSVKLMGAGQWATGF